MVSRGNRALGVLIAVACTGCVLQPKPTPVLATPDKFDQATGSRSAAWPSLNWYHGFASPELDALVAEASRNNFDLAAAKARVLQADARARQSHGAIVPSVDVAGNANYLAGRSSYASAHETDWAALLSANYEVDFWSKNRAAYRATRYLAAASRADRDTVALTTLAGIANSYFQVLALRERLTIAHSNVDAARGVMEAVDSRYRLGLANPVEVATQKAALASAQLAIPDLEQSEQEATAALALLLGRAPEGFRIKGMPIESITEPPVYAGLPSELLVRRPDIFSAEAKLRSASANVVVARAAMYPSLLLTVAGGLQNPALNGAVLTLSGVGPTLNIGAALLEPIFNGGKLRAQHAEALAVEQEALTTYRAAIVAALVDVENALSAIKRLDSAREFQQENLNQSERAFAGAKIRYENGQGDFLTVLEGQRILYAARDQSTQFKLARLQALVSLCKALGGGWQASDATAAPAAMQPSDVQATH